MGYAQTDILMYAVSVSYQEVVELLPELCGPVFEREQAEAFFYAKQEWHVTTEDLLWAHEMLGYNCDAYLESLGMTISCLFDFYDTFGFMARYARRSDICIEPWSSGGRDFETIRYHIDFLCDRADSRGNSLRALPGHTSYFGVVLGANGYGAKDDLTALATDLDPRVLQNFANYVAPVLERCSWKRVPTLVTVDQMR